MSHPDLNAPADLTPIQIGDILENPVTREHATVLKLPWNNSDGRAIAELLAQPGARVVGEHRHPANGSQDEVARRNAYDRFPGHSWRKTHDVNCENSRRVFCARMVGEVTPQNSSDKFVPASLET